MHDEDKELKRVDSLSRYKDEQLDFDKQLIRFRYESFNHFFKESCLNLVPQTVR